MHKIWMRRFVPVLFLFPSILHADRGNGVSAGLILSQDSSARAASLGGAVNALNDDVAAVAYNPAALCAIESNQALVAFQRGLVDDNFSQVQLGQTLPDAGYGASLAIYNGGEMDYIRGSTRKTVTSQRDISAALSYAHNLPPGFVSKIHYASVGISVKYLSSELVETEKASTVAFDFGAAASINRRFRVAAAYQNLGANLRYGNEESEIPEVARLGASYRFRRSRLPTLLIFDVPYLVNEARFAPAAGLEVGLGAVAFRAGYRSGIDLGGFTLGAGVAVNRFTMDYAFGLMNDLNSTHRVSVGFHWGHSPTTYFAVEPLVVDNTPPAIQPELPKPAQPAPVFMGTGRSGCVDEKSDSSVLIYGHGRAKCADLK